eukprot:SM000012S25324  [mRNA]  locus=s12:331658:332986:- [translate_table: standard]
MASSGGFGEAASARDVPGDPRSTASAVLNAGTSAVQSFRPLGAVHAHLCALHFYAHDLSRQVEAHHYCAHPSEDFHQCLIYDSDEPGARLIGVEYVVGDAVFAGLPEEEKKLWHSHEYEVKSGMLIMPRVPGLAENQMMKSLIKSYGKTWHFWQFDKGDTLPLGTPQLMMSMTQDGQAYPALLKHIEQKYDVSLMEKRQQRSSLEGPAGGVHPLADHWKTGRAFQTKVEEAGAD